MLRMLSQLMQLAAVFIIYEDDHCSQGDISFLAVQPVQLPKKGATQGCEICVLENICLKLVFL